MITETEVNMPEILMNLSSGASQLRKLDVPIRGTYDTEDGNNGWNWTDHWTITYGQWKEADNFEELSEEAISVFSVSRKYGPMPVLEGITAGQNAQFWALLDAAFEAASEWDDGEFLGQEMWGYLETIFRRAAVEWTRHVSAGSPIALRQTLRSVFHEYLHPLCRRPEVECAKLAYQPKV